jgi:hypothetical protein
VKSKSVFISSTTRDLHGYRMEAHAVIDELNRLFRRRMSVHPVHMDTEPQTGERKTAVEVSRGWVSQADWMILIVGWNYGYVHPHENPEAISVTEWEYRQATHSTPPKERFVYLAGDLKDQDKAYRPPRGEVPHLYEWTDVEGCRHQDADSLQKAKKFRAELRKRDVRLFPDLGAFRRQLFCDLFEAMFSLLEKESLSVTSPGLPLQLTALISDLDTLALNSIKEVRSLANLKRIHDCLHRIRQHGVSRWRHEVIGVWPDASMSDAVATPYRAALKEIEQLRGKLDELIAKLPAATSNETLKKQCTEVIAFGFGTDLPAECAKFRESVDRFGDLVQQAFTYSDHLMQKSAARLEICHEQMQRRGASRQRDCQLPCDGEERLSAELSEIAAQHGLLQKVLADHHLWQSVHDRLQALDGTFGTEWFEPEIAKLERWDHIRTLLDLTDQHARTDERLSGWLAISQTARAHLHDLASAGSTQERKRAYTVIRDSFDELFLEVDTETLRAVNAAEKRISTHCVELLRLRQDLQTGAAPQPAGN